MHHCWVDNMFEVDKLSLSSLSRSSLPVAVYFGAVYLGSVCLGSVCLGAVYLGAVCLGAVYLRSVRLGAVCLVAVCLRGVHCRWRIVQLVDWGRVECLWSCCLRAPCHSTYAKKVLFLVRDSPHVFLCMYLCCCSPFSE